MKLLSVVIITYNEEHNIAACINAAKQVSDDIIVVDSGSSDETVGIACSHGAQVFSINWEGYGHSRNFGAAKAKNNWIFSLDADERVSEELAAAVNQIDFGSAFNVYRCRRKNYLGNEHIRFGTPGFEKVTRIYNREAFDWDLSLVHEKLEPSSRSVKHLIDGQLIHFGLKNYDDYYKKVRLYALLSAEKYMSEGRKASLAKRLGSPVFNAIKSYIFQLGFLEGKQGFQIARTIAYYSWLKYYYLQQMQLEAESVPVALSFSTAPKISN